MQSLQELAKNGSCQLVGGCDPNIEALKAKSAGSLENLRLFETCEELLAWGEMDCVVIASPPHLHYEHAMRAIDRGLFVYLEKPPTATYWQLQDLLRHPRADRVAVGFQLLEIESLRALKAKLAAGELGELREVNASGLWPRRTSYYARAPWAGRMQAEGRPVFDGPLTNALAHIVHNVFYFAGHGASAFAVPRTVSGYFARARPMESYDFAWIKGTTEEGVAFNVAAGHCTDRIVLWSVTVRTDRGLFHVTESEVPPTLELLIASHRSALAAYHGTAPPTTSLADCLGYSMSTTAGHISSAAIHDIPADEIQIVGQGPDTAYHVERLHPMIAKAQQENTFPAQEIPWLKLGAEVDCRAALATRSPLLE